MTTPTPAKRRPAKKKPMTLGWDTAIPPEPRETRTAFKIPDPMPGVLPAGHTGMAMDSGFNSAYQFAAMNSAYSDGMAFLGFQELALMTQRAEYRRPAEILAKEMTRKWIKLQVTGEQDKQEALDQIEAEMKRLNLQGVIRKAAEQDGFFGRSQIYVDLGVDFNERDELRTPLSAHANKVKKGSLKGLTVIEPLWTYPNNYNSTNPMDPAFYKPQSWFIMGTEVHASRLLTIIGRPLPDLLKPAYAFGGLSLSQMAKPYVDNWLRTRQSVSDLLHAFSIMGLKTNMTDILNGGASEMLRRRMQMFNAHRDNRGMFVMDKDTEELLNVSAPLSGLDHLQAQSQEQMSSVTGIPLSILLGITPTGLNASTDGEIRTFYQWVESQQEATLTAPVNFILSLIQLNLWGKIDPDITFIWEPLWSMDEKEQAEIRKTDADTDAVYLQEGVITQQEVRARIANAEDSPYAGLGLSVELEPPQPDPSQEPDPMAEVDEHPGDDGDGGSTD